jgi:hypothetical protein
MLEGVGAMSPEVTRGVFEILLCFVQMSHRSIDLGVFLSFCLHLNLFEFRSALSLRSGGQTQGAG